MTPENFTYWLQGYFEISGNEKLKKKEAQVVKDHLDLVFEEVNPKKRQEFTRTSFTPYSIGEATGIAPSICSG